MERHLKEATVTTIEEIGVGVTRPRRVHLEPAEPFESLAWKVIPPSRKSGWLFLQRIYSEKYFFCSSRMSMEASAIVPKTFCELR